MRPAALALSFQIDKPQPKLPNTMKLPMLNGRTFPKVQTISEMIKAEPEPFAPPPSVLTRQTVAPYERWLAQEFRAKLDRDERELYVSEMLTYLQSLPRAEAENLLTFHTFPEILTKGIRSGELTNLLRDD